MSRSLARASASVPGIEMSKSALSRRSDMLRGGALAVILVGALVAGCVQPPPAAQAPSPSAGPTGSAMRVTSAAFQDGAPIPVKYTCDGAAAHRGGDASADASAASVSPPLVISSLPANASTVALLMLDNDVPVPQAPSREVVHWIWWNARVENGTVTVPEGALANGTVQGTGTGGAKYAGPCPPQFSTAHRYVLTAHAVAGALNLKEGASKEELVAALAGNSIASAKLTGTYARAILPRSG